MERIICLGNISFKTIETTSFLLIEFSKDIDVITMKLFIEELMELGYQPVKSNVSKYTRIGSEIEVLEDLYDDDVRVKDRTEISYEINFR